MVLALAITALALGAAFIIPKGLASPTYTVNGLTCPFESGTPANVISLVTKVTQNARFLNATEKGQFMLGNYENITARSESVDGGPIVYLPDAIELVFYSPQTVASTCQRQLGLYYWIDVQVPVQDGDFNMTGAQISRATGPY